MKLRATILAAVVVPGASGTLSLLRTLDVPLGLDALDFLLFMVDPTCLLPHVGKRPGEVLRPTPCTALARRDWAGTPLTAKDHGPSTHSGLSGLSSQNTWRPPRATLRPKRSRRGSPNRRQRSWADSSSSQRPPEPCWRTAQAVPSRQAHEPSPASSQSS